ncbi:unhealthy ribosome biogenesis protein 2 homolog [Lingula anatina]|uniref:Unhealthy ribosome biogenesis protein 2 homolog n=1 Tax=Lingula anatina TaxID=7574 RepID=A0A1S3H4Y8_LINAN|nr:unhealthy ribosome biogenesis protein 2 homolog [Lingula anatina]|eukprot:XP_013380199.2 unhealthy ribosome biogenesis protein 2 homolog [Lingula anatina]
MLQSNLFNKPCSGLHLKLKDRFLPWESKLKLARFVWASKGVVIPNKEQYVIDWLTGALLNKKKWHVVDENLLPMWALLAELLQILERGKTCGVLLKPSFVQTLTDMFTTTNKNAAYKLCLSHVTCCCRIVLETSSYCHVVVSRFETVLQLLNSYVSVLLQRFSKVNDSHGEDQQLFLHVLDLLLTRYSILQRQHANQKQVFHAVVDGALVNFVLLLQSLRLSSKMSIAQKLQDIIMAVIYHKDHQSQFSLYMSILQGETDAKTQPPKLQEDMFVKLKTATEKMMSCLELQHQQEAVLNFISMLYEGFLASIGTSSTATQGFAMLKHLCDHLGIISQDSPIPARMRISTLASLLEVLHRKDVYNAVTDNSSGGHQIKWLQGLVDFLLNNFQSVPSWYKSVSSLLQISTATIQTRLQQVLEVGWLNTGDRLDPPTTAAQDLLFCGIITMHEKLRRVHKLIGTLLQVLRGHDKRAQLPGGFVEKFSQCVAQLPQGQTVDIWASIQDEVSSFWVNNLHLATFPTVCELYHLCLHHARLFDYSVTGQTTKRVSILTEEMKTKILLPMLEKKEGKKQDSVWSSVILLNHAWGDVSLMSSIYKQQSITMETSLHGYLTQQQWSDIAQKIMKKKWPCSQLLMQMLSLQSLRYHLLYGSSMTESSSELFSNLAEESVSLVVTSWEELDGAEVAVWDGRVPSLSKFNLPVAQWHLVVSNLLLLIPYLSSATIHRLASLMVGAALREEDDSEGSPVKVISVQFMTGSVCHEMAPLHGYFVSEVFARIAQCLRSARVLEGKIVKKRKLFWEECADVLDTAAVTEAKDSGKENTRAVEKLNQLLKERSTLPWFKFDIKTVLECLQVLKMMPIEHLESSLKISCLTSLLALILTTQTDHTVKTPPEDKAMSTALFNSCLDIVVIITDQWPGVWSVARIEVLDALCWIMTIADSKIIMSQYGSVDFQEELNQRRLVESLVRGIRTEEQISLAKDLLKEDRQTHMWLVFTEKLTKQLLKLLKKPNMDSTLESACVACLKQVEFQVSNAIKEAAECSECPTFALRLDAYCALLHGGRLQENNENISAMCQRCLRLLEEDESNHDILQSCLNFIKSVSEVAIDEVLVDSAWKSCLTCYRRLLANQESGDQETANQESGDTKAASQETRNLKTTKLKSGEKETTNQNTGVEESESGKSSFCNTGKMLNKKDMAELKTSQTSCEFEEKQLQQVRDLLLEVLVTMLQKCSVEQFQSLLHDLMARTTYPFTPSVLHVWTTLVDRELEETKLPSLAVSVQNLNLLLQGVALDLQTKTPLQQRGALLPVLQFVTKVLSQKKIFLSSQSVLVCLHSCLYVPLKDLQDHTQFFEIHKATYDVLNALLIDHAKVLYGAIPVFQQAVRSFMEAILEVGWQKQDGDCAVRGEEDVIGCALLADRLFSLMISHKSEFGKVVMYLVADYVHYLQRGTLRPAVKKVLVSAMCKLLSICDQHSIAVLHTALSQGAKEIFKGLYQEYEKYHKYTGRV